MEGGGAPVRSRSSQTPSSPSHSTASAASSHHHHHKRNTTNSNNHPKPHSHPLPPPPPPADEDDNMTEDPFDEDDDEDDTEDPEQFEDDDEDEEEENDGKNKDNSSLRNFNAARFDHVKKNKVKVEGGGGGGEREMPGIVVKDDVGKGIFTENVQISGAYSAREEGLKREEDTGRLKFMCCANDGIDEHMIWLIGLKNIFSRQLPNMPKEYIVRLVMDRSHKSMMIIRNNLVVGGITYRPYISVSPCRTWTREGCAS